MSIDLSEFHDIFFEECFEGLEIMESGLLSLDNGADVEEINAIFRAAHSIKGGGASFGFNEISSFTHVMETLLDEMRDGRREVSRTVVDLLLESVDVLREMVTAAKAGDESEVTRTAEVKAKLDATLSGNSGDETADSAENEPATQALQQDISESPADTASQATEPASKIVTSDVDSDTSRSPNCWRITFKPHENMLKSGNDPLRIIRELETLGELSVVSDTNAIPSLKEIQPESSYMSWKIDLKSDASEDEIREVFNWVEDECDLSIEKPLSDLAETEEQSQLQGEETDPDSSKEAPPVQNTTTAAKSGPAQAIEQIKSETAKEQAPAKRKATSNNKETGSIRVGIDKVDALINMVGELVITQSMLSQIGSNLTEMNTGNYENLLDGITLLERNTRELQESVLQIRMLPISFSFSRFPRLVRDLSKNMGKKIELKMTGEQTEVDKNVLEKIGDPLVHLVRNSMDHGIEMPDVRKQAGKPELGTLELCAYHEGGDIIIQVIDDGAGLNRDRILKKAIDKGLVSENEELSDDRIYNLIFMPGFSTADQISDVSGRGVGMDVVRRNVRDLGGNVSVSSNPGAGSTVTIRLPLTLAILDGQLVRIGKETYIVSLVSIVESLQMQPELINCITGQSELYRLRDEYIPIIRVNDLFELDPRHH